MPFADLRSFLECLDAHDELVHVKKPVALEYELGAVTYENAQAGGPALWFDHPGDGPVPMVVTILEGLRRYSLAMEAPIDQLHSEWTRRTATPIPPVTVSSGPCKENILKGEAADLFKFSIPTWNGLDGGPYITFPVIISRDPTTGTRNAAIYRLQVHGPRSTGILAEGYRHLSQQRRKAGKNEPFPVAIALGTDPTIPMAASAAFQFGVDELAMAGALRGSPVELVPCETVPLEVPATSEIVIEGVMDPDDVQEEGPYGEYTGYYGERARRPVIRVTAITHRDNPIHVGHYTGRLSAEATALSIVPLEAELLRQIPIPGVHKLTIAPGGRGLICIASIRKAFEGYGTMMGMAILGTWPGRRIKIMIVVDDDVDPANWHDVEWALSTRVQPHRDVTIIPSVTGPGLDPSPSEEDRARGTTSKMIIDATKFDAAKYPEPCMPRADVLEEVRRNWATYGIPNGRVPATAIPRV